MSQTITEKQLRPRKATSTLVIRKHLRDGPAQRHQYRIWYRSRRDLKQTEIENTEAIQVDTEAMLVVLVQCLVKHSP